MPTNQPADEPKTITAYKAFDDDWTCRGFQYMIGETYEHEGKVEICNSGFHACLSPFDCWSYYDVAGSKFAEVELSGETDKDNKTTKIAAAKITVTAKLSLPEFISRGVNWLLEHTKGANSGDLARIGSSSNSARIGSSGDFARIGSSGYSARIKVEGQDSVIASAGINTHVKGATGTWVSVAEFGNGNKCIGFATGCIGEKGLKPATWYMAKGGKLVEAE